ncbi:MAG: hypothetical protein K2M13_06265 [Muribaculaceae bacterium]|nr:hypothetical protein [Muribaculaceae bacterium]
MTKILLALFLLAGLTCYAEADNIELQRVNNKVIQLSQTVESLTKENQQLKNNVTDLQKGATVLQEQIVALEAKSDSVDNVLMIGVSSNTELANNNHAVATEKIQVVETTSQSNIHQLTVWGLWAIVALLIVAIVIYIVLHRGISKGTDAIFSIRVAQGNLEEESVKLDTKLVELLDKQLSIEKNQAKADTSVAQQVAIPDHSLALKVADEITRIEKNLSRMDPSVKGYKPLVKAIDRIKNNFKANGYEIVTYLGQPYNEGMRINPEFVIDETLPEGTRTITSVSKPQVHYNGELIQKASVTVSQNI